MCPNCWRDLGLCTDPGEISSEGAALTQGERVSSHRDRQRMTLVTTSICSELAGTLSRWGQHWQRPGAAESLIFSLCLCHLYHAWHCFQGPQQHLANCTHMPVSAFFQSAESSSLGGRERRKRSKSRRKRGRHGSIFFANMLYRFLVKTLWIDACDIFRTHTIEFIFRSHSAFCSTHPNCL